MRVDERLAELIVEWLELEVDSSEQAEVLRVLRAVRGAILQRAREVQNKEGNEEYAEVLRGLWLALGRARDRLEGRGR